MIQTLLDPVIDGYDANGIAEYIFRVLKTHLPLQEILNDYEISEKGFKKEIKCALEEIGIKDSETSVSQSPTLEKKYNKTINN